jgi:hypothetical protein
MNEGIFSTANQILLVILREGPGVLALLEKAKANRYPALAILRRAAEVANVDDTVQKYECLIHWTIHQLEKPDFRQQHLDMADMRLDGKCFPLIKIPP